MLSKLEYFESGGEVPESSVHRQALQQALQRRFCSSRGATNVTPAAGGTLGVCFHLDVGGARRFLKVHLPSERARENLAKEADILLRLYGGAVVLDLIEVQPEGGATRLCLVMAELSHPTAPVAAEDIAAMVRSYTRALEGCRPADLTPGCDFERYLTHGSRAIAVLWDRGLIVRQTVAELERHLELLHRELGALPRALCHGDLGPKNIMTDGSKLIAIDWEDAFWGIAGYDYLCWLTFFENRRLLRSSAFGHTRLGSVVERAILALVLLLKSFLSVRSGTYRGNTVPIETRIAEVLALPEAA
jgi:hypothetical protein